MLSALCWLDQTANFFFGSAIQPWDLIMTQSAMAPASAIRIGSGTLQNVVFALHAAF
jgi:hypothetical protein